MQQPTEKCRKFLISIDHLFLFYFENVLFYNNYNNNLQPVCEQICQLVYTFVKLLNLPGKIVIKEYNSCV
ncbi:hypothetical protein T07_4945 [Trichinella nelsoni]|uniref:Uncharacterized protein n=1 Tax=Trichinella nelsoni TaxID=6336 RepID=A0A0V0SNX1_9BILA|nr:hypothetical protein T07_4945 [Trichinella nelsoni]